MRNQMLRACVVSLALVQCLAAQADSGQAPKSGRAQAPAGSRVVHVFWEGSLAAAKARATRIGRPIVVAILGTDRLSRRLLDSVYTAPEVRALLREYVCVVACAEAVAPIESGPRKGKSSLFRTVTAAEHQAVMGEVRKKYLGDERITIPQHLFLNSEGHLIEQVERLYKTDDVVEKLERILDKQDPGWKPVSLEVAATAGKKAVAPKVGSDVEAGGVPWAGLFDADTKVRDRTVAKLLATGDASLVKRIYKQLGDPDTKICVLAASRKLPGPLTKALAIEAVSDKDSVVRAQGAVAAEAYAKPDVLDVLTKRYKKEKDDQVQRELVRAIGACAKGDKKALDVLVSATKSRNDALRANAYVAMGVAGSHSNSVASRMGDALIKRGLKDRDSNTRAAAVWALGNIRLKRAAPLIEKLIKRDRGRKTKKFYRDALRRINGENVTDWDWIRPRRIYAREQIKR